jgi:hypothetical protein
MSKAIQDRGEFFNFDLASLEHVRFYAANDHTVLATYVKDGSVSLSMSLDGGATFINSENILKVHGDIKDIQVLAKDNQFVVGIQETVSGKDHKRAVAGWIFPNESTSRFKECTESEVEGKIMNISLGFRENESGGYESVDYVFYLNENGKVSMQSKGHPCLLK